MLAAFWMLGGIVSFSVMAIAGRTLSLEHDTFEILLFRSVIGIGLVLLVAAIAGTLPQISTRNMSLHVTRNVFHFTGQNLWFFAITVLPLAQVFALEFTSPIWVALLAPLVLSETLTRGRLFAIALGFVGVLVVVRPDPMALDIRVLAALASAIGFAGSALFTRKLTRTVSITCILFWLTTIQAILGVVCAGWDGAIRMPGPDALPWMCLLAAAGLTAHFCLTTALGLAPAAIVMPMDFARLPVIAVIGMLLYGERIDIWIALGAAIIFGANWLNIREGSSRSDIVR